MGSTSSRYHIPTLTPLLARISNPCQEDHGWGDLLVDHQQKGLVHLDVEWRLHGQCLGARACRPFRALLIHLQLSLVHRLQESRAVQNLSCHSATLVGLRQVSQGRRWHRNNLAGACKLQLCHTLPQVVKREPDSRSPCVSRQLVGIRFTNF